MRISLLDALKLVEFVIHTKHICYGTKCSRQILSKVQVMFSLAPDFHEDTDLSWRNRRRREIPNPARSPPGKGVATPSFAAKAGFVAGVEGATETALLSALDRLVQS